MDRICCRITDPLLSEFILLTSSLRNANVRMRIWKHHNKKKREKKSNVMCFANDVTIFVAHSSKDNPKKDQLFLQEVRE